MDPSYWLIAAGVPTFLALQFIAAPYGKFAPSNSSKSVKSSMNQSVWGPPINARLAWFIQETPSLIMSVLTFIMTANEDQFSASGNRVLLGLYIYHYIFRAWLIPFLSPSTNTSMPLVVCMLSFIFCVCNGWLQGYAIGHSVDAFEISDMSLIQWIGCFLFLCGWASNQYSDHILRRLRQPNNQPGNQSVNQPTNQSVNQSTNQSTNRSINQSKSHERSYHIPYGGLFTYITSANYFSEFVEWLGWALMCQSMAAFGFAFYTAANLFPRAKHTHEWYQHKFPNYPKDRKIVIPFVW